MEQKKIPVIIKKTLLLIVFSGFLLCTVVSVAGYLGFSRQFRSQYDASIRSIGEASRACLNPDDFSLYMNTKIRDE